MPGIIEVSGNVPYYSPNSRRSTLLVTIDPTHVNPFKPSRPSKPRLAEVTLPRRWSKPFGWLCFIPLRPFLRGYPFDTLSSLPALERDGHILPIPLPSDHLGMDPEALEEYVEAMRSTMPPPDPPTFRISQDRYAPWRVLEANLYKSVVSLKSRYEIPMVLPFLPFGLGYGHEKFTSSTVARICIKDSRDWFYVWMGALSYAIAFSLARQKESLRSGYRQFPGWQDTLAEAGFDAAWIDGIQYSAVCDFSPQNARAGCIIDKLNATPDQPSLDWFLEHGIPVWFKMDSFEEAVLLKKLDHNPTSISRLGAFKADYFDADGLFRLPPVADGMTAPTSAVNNDSNGSNTASSSSTHFNCRSRLEITHSSPEQGRKEDPAWVVHFEQRKQRHTRLLELETPVQRERRLNRLRDPPTSSAPVFEWFPSEANPEVYERIPVRADFRGDTLALYGSKQKRYDPFFNEWDCCDEFGDPDDEDEDAIYSSNGGVNEDTLAINISDEDAYGFKNSPHLINSTIQHEDRSLVIRESHSAISFPTQASSELEGSQPSLSLQSSEGAPTSPLQTEVQEIFGQYYGFQAPLPTAHIPVHSNSLFRSLFLQVLGAGHIDPTHEYFDTLHYRATQSFFDLLSQRKTPAEGSWDIDDSSMFPLKLSPRLRQLTLLPNVKRSREEIDNGRSDDVPSYYVFNFIETHWKLAVLSPEAALLVCRLPHDYSPDTIAFQLAQRAVPFRIFSVASPHPPHTLREQVSFQRPVRKFNYKFTKRDYESYINIRTLMLSQPHMQAALRRGGIVWRLAISVLGLNDVTKPATLHRGFIEVAFHDSSETWVEDGLTKDELDLICGVYECISDDGKDRALRSWWPQALHYDKEECGENHGRWCYRREQWYTERLKDIEAGTEPLSQPLTYNEWKSKQRGSRPIRTFHKEVRTSARKFLEVVLS